MKQNMAVREKKVTVRGINWVNISPTENRAGLHGSLSAETRFLISFLGVRHVLPDAKKEKPTLDIYGRMFVPQSLELKGMFDAEGQELVDLPWTAKNYPPDKYDPLFTSKSTGITMMESDEAGMMTDLALVISFSKVRREGRYPLYFGLPLGCPVATHKPRRGRSTLYFLFPPKCGQAEFFTQIPATSRLFPKLPGRMHMALALVRARLEYSDRLQVYVTNSFYAVKFLNFPTVSLRDLNRISI